MIEACKTRLAIKVPELTGRIDGAAEFAALVRDNRLPQATPAAFVIPLGIVGGTADAVAGMFTQGVRESIGVMLIFRTNSATAERALGEIEGFIDATLTAVCGWAPGDETGVFQLARGALVTFRAGTVVYQLDFTINDQLRITP